MNKVEFNALSVGDVIPELTLAPISRTTLGLYAGASGDHNPIHIDIDFAKKAGMKDVFAHGMLIMAYLGRMLTNWVPQSALRSYQVRFSSITQVHDKITCTGRIVEKIDDDKSVRVEIQAANQDGDVKLSGEAVIELAGA